MLKVKSISSIRGAHTDISVEQTDYKWECNLDANLNQQDNCFQNSVILNNIKKDTEDLRLSWMKHNEIHACLVDKYLWWDKNNSKSVSDLIDFSLGKND